MNIFVYLLVYLSMSVVAHADQPSYGVPVLSTGPIAVKAIKSAETPVSPNLLPVNIPKDDLKNGTQNYHERKYAEAISALIQVFEY